MRTVVFDLDGTLADTSGDLIAAANACFVGLGFGAVLDPAQDQSTAFAGGRAMLRLGAQRLAIGENEAAQIVEEQYGQLLAHYGDNIDRFTALYPGAQETLEDLKSAGYALSVCTNKPEGLAETLLARLGIRGMFGALVGADTLPVRKPDPAPLRAAVERVGGQMSQSVLIGDTITDRNTALAASVPCVLVTFGPDGEGVKALNPDACLDKYSDLPLVLETIFAK
jgi:phosphoglycolate phosphatase